MKVKTSITLSQQALQAIDDIAGAHTNRSRIIEQAVIEFIERHRRARRDAQDLDILNRSAEALNREVEEILVYQAEPWGAEISIEFAGRGAVTRERVAYS